MTLKPLGRMTLRILAGTIFMALAAIAVRFGVLPLMDQVFTLSDTQMALVRRVSMLTAFGFGFWLYIRLIERRAAHEMSINPRQWLVWGGMGAALIALPMGIIYLLDGYEILSTGPLWSVSGIALTILAAAAFEELLFRGVIVPAVEDALGPTIALLAPSLLFSLLHFFNPNWAGWISLITGVLLGVLWTLVYLITRNVWAATLNHALWNFTIVLSGLPLTGIEEWRALAPLQSDHVGPTWLTGGAAGPEESLVTVFVVSAAVAGLWVYWRRQQSLSPGAKHSD